MSFNVGDRVKWSNTEDGVMYGTVILIDDTLDTDFQLEVRWDSPDGEIGHTNSFTISGYFWSTDKAPSLRHLSPLEELL